MKRKMNNMKSFIEESKKEFLNNTFGADLKTSVYSEINWDLVWSFIEQKLIQQREMIKGEVEKMKVKFVEDGFYGREEELDRNLGFEIAYNQALNDILKLLNK